jgi:hypothetical protein
VELFEAIRRDRRREGLSIRELADKHRMHRRTVRQALASAGPPPRKLRVFAAPVLDPVKPLIDAMLRQDVDAPQRQRHTARRVLARLVDEHGVTNVSYSTVRDYAARRRPEILAEASKPLEVGCVPQTHEPGAEALCGFPHRASAPGGGSGRRGRTSSACRSGKCARTYRRTLATLASRPCSSASRWWITDTGTTGSSPAIRS